MSDAVKHPEHYLQFGVEVADIIKTVLNAPENACASGYDAYCMGNELKYRLRAGFKGAYTEDMEKAMQYNRMRERSPLHEDRAFDVDTCLGAAISANTGNYGVQAI